MKGPRYWLRSSRQLLRGSWWRGACTVAAPDAITAFTVPNPGCSSRGSRFFRVWWLGELPRQANHLAYFGLVNLTWTNPFNRRQLDATPATSRNASDVDHKSHLGRCKTHNFCAKTPSDRGGISQSAGGNGNNLGAREGTVGIGVLSHSLPGVAALQPARFALGLRAFFRTTPGLLSF